MKSLQFTFGALVIGVFSLTACATDRMTDNERLALYRAHAAAPVQSFRYLSRIDGWTPLGDEAVAI